VARDGSARGALADDAPARRPGGATRRRCFGPVGALDASIVEAHPEAALEAAAAPVAALRPGAWQAVAHGLLARAPAASRAATRVVEVAILDGRFDPDALGASLAWTIAQGSGVIARAVGHLRDVAWISDLHGAQVFRTFDAFLAATGPVDKASIGLLEMMFETGAALGASVGDDARRTLERSIESVGPGTKLATLGRGLLALERTRDSRFDRARTAAAVAVVDGADRVGTPTAVS